MIRTSLSIALVFACTCLTLIGCGPGGGTYCQTGPKYGTQCYSRMDLDPPGTAPSQPDDRSRR